jgi:hypothetical protein
VCFDKGGEVRTRIGSPSKKSTAAVKPRTRDALSTSASRYRLHLLVEVSIKATQM